jgi:hypothetical protein
MIAESVAMADGAKGVRKPEGPNPYVESRFAVEQVLNAPTRPELASVTTTDDGERVSALDSRFRSSSTSFEVPGVTSAALSALWAIVIRPWRTGQR